MEGGSLFNSGVLGSSFLWWIGQIADDSTWRDNRLAGKFKSKDTIPGWGARYKVRILGIHDQGQAEIKEEDLPWANILYPVTAGGGQTNSWMSSNLRQGNFVFGFWMDGQDMQVPIIMGVLGNNAQTALATKIGKVDDTGVSNTQPGSLAKSGYSTGEVEKTTATKELVPQEGLVTERPGVSPESSPSPPGESFNQYGLPDSRPATQEQLNDIATGRSTGSAQGLSGKDLNDHITGTVQSGIQARAAAENSPTNPPKPGPTKENPDAMHQLSAADVVRNDKYNEKIVLLKPGHIVQSATKAMQTEVDNLSAKMDKFMGSQQNYIDAVSSPMNQEQLQQEIKKTAAKMARFQKIIMDKVAEYQEKKLNASLAPVVASMPSSMRAVFGDQKFQNATENIKNFNGITNKLTEQLEGILQGKFSIPKLAQQAAAQAASGILFSDPVSQSAVQVLDLSNSPPNTAGATPTTTGGGATTPTTTGGDDSVGIATISNQVIRTPKVPVCYAEDIAAQVISVNKDSISQLASAQHKNYNRFLEGLKSQLEKSDQEAEEKAYDKSNVGKVLKITDEEEDDLPQGGTNYYSENGVPCTGGSGTGFKVDIIVPSGGWYDDSFATINDEGAGYYVDTANGAGVSGTGTTTGISATGGSGSGLKLDFTISGGKITGISTNTVGANYKNGDVLTISQGSQAAINPTTYATFTLDKVRGIVNTVANGGITIADPGSGYKMGELLIVSQQGSNQNCGVVVIQVMDPGESKATAGPVTPGDTSGSVADSKPSLGQKLGDMLSMLGGISGNLTEALDFVNLETNMFPFESPANQAVSDYYTLNRGGATQGDTEAPSSDSIRKAANTIDPSSVAKALKKTGFAGPTLGTPPINLVSDQISGLKGKMGSLGLNSGNTQGMINSALQQASSMNPQVELEKAARQVVQSDDIKDAVGDVSDALNMF